MNTRTKLLAAGVGVAVVSTVVIVQLTQANADETVVRASADTTSSSVPQDGNNSVKTTLATCPQLCDRNPNGRRDAVLEFDVSNLPAGAMNVRAKLRMFAWTDFNAKVTAYPADGGARSSGDWSQHPVLGAPLSSTSKVVKGHNDFDVTAIVKANGKYTFALQQETLNTRVYWASRENRNTKAHPVLLLTYQRMTGNRPTPGTVTQPPPKDDPKNPTPSPSASASATATPSASATRPGGGAGAPGPAVPGWRMVWSDEFNGSNLDGSKWNAKNNTSVDYDRACITSRPNNVFVSNGVLTLRAQKENYTCHSQGRGYTVGYLDTIGKASFTYGRFEARAKSPNTPNNSRGLWPAFWMRPNDGGGGEIDVMELPGGSSWYKGSTQGIFLNYTGTKQDNRYMFSGGGYPGDGFHTYTTEWEPGVIRWYIDGKEVWRRDRATTPWWDQVFNKPYNLRLNFQVGGWLGDPDAATRFPADFQVDYIRVWQR